MRGEEGLDRSRLSYGAAKSIAITTPIFRSAPRCQHGKPPSVPSQIIDRTARPEVAAESVAAVTADAVEAVYPD
jgi:hypothetical protein